MILFLDDSDFRIQAFEARYPDAIIVRTAEEAIDQLKANADLVWESVWLDHDLGGETLVDIREENSGSEVARWIVANRPSIVEIVVHSWNPVGAAHMVVDLMGAGYVVHRWPFDTSTLFAGHEQ